MRISYPIGKKLDDPLWSVNLAANIQIDQLLFIVFDPAERQTSEHNNDGNLEGKHCVEHLIHHFHEVADFAGRFLRIFKDLSFIANIDTDPIGILNILQGSASQE